MPKYKRTILLLMSDSHGGFTLGLTNPNTPLPNEFGDVEYPRMSESQSYLWNDVYLPGLEKTIDLAGKDKIVAFHLGDISHGNKHISEQESTRIANQFLIAAANFEPVLDKSNVNTLRIAIGTGAHTFGEGSSTIIVERLLKNKYKKKDIRALYHGLADVGGITIDYSHHGPYPGSRNWLKGNVARYYLRSLMMDEIMDKKIPPSLVLRGHYHTYVREILEVGDYESQLLILPSLCLAGDYTRKATQSVSRIENGVVAVEIINGHIYKTHKFTAKLDVRTEENL